MFLHDPLLKIENIRLRPNRQQSGKPSNNYGGKDSFYWPDMERKEILLRIDPATGLVSSFHESKISRFLLFSSLFVFIVLCVLLP